MTIPSVRTTKRTLLAAYGWAATYLDSMCYRALRGENRRSVNSKAWRSFLSISVSTRFPQRGSLQTRNPLGEYIVSRQTGRFGPWIGVTLTQTGASTSKSRVALAKFVPGEKRGTSRQQTPLTAMPRCETQQNQPNERIKYQRKQRERPTKKNKMHRVGIQPWQPLTYYYARVRFEVPSFVRCSASACVRSTRNFSIQHHVRILNFECNTRAEAHEREPMSGLLPAEAAATSCITGSTAAPRPSGSTTLQCLRP